MSVVRVTAPSNPAVTAPSNPAVPHSRRTFMRRRYRGPESNPRKAVTL